MVDPSRKASKRFTVLVMDDAAVVRRLLAEMLAEIDSVERVIQAGDASSALRLMQEHKPDIAILDISVSGVGAFRNVIVVLRTIKQSQPGTKVIMLMNHATDWHRTEWLKAGADHFFDKSSEFEELLEQVAAYGHQ